MHRDRQFACNRNGGALKADALPEFEAPAPQAVVGRAAGQDDRRRFVEKPSQMAIAPAGNVAIIVDLSRLVAPGRQPQPGADRARDFLKLSGSSMAVAKDVAVIAPTPGIDIRMRQAWFWRELATS
jgi:hypothetical protein